MVTKAHLKFGMKKDGLASAVVMNQVADAGVCASTQEFMLAVGTNTLPILCKTDNKKYDAEVVVTNHMPSGSFRGYGVHGVYGSGKSGNYGGMYKAGY